MVTSPTPKRLALLAAGLWLSAVACGSPPQSGEARVIVTTQALSATDVAKVTVTVSGANISPDIVHDFKKTGDRWTGIIGHIPAGSDRTFHGAAYDASGTEIYSGQVSGVAITKGAPVTILLLLQQSTAPQPFANGVPVVDGLTLSSNKVGPGEPVVLALSAHDPDPADTLSYAWSATGGSFDPPSTAATSWTAPLTEGSYTLTATVTDGRGGSNGLTVSVDVRQHYATGKAKVDIELNTWPTIAGLTATPGQVPPGGSTALDLTASDGDGQQLAYTWSDGGGDCAGSFNDDQVEDPSWTAPAAAPPSGACTLTVTVTDGDGGSTVGSIVVPVATLVTPNVAPMIQSTYQSTGRAPAGATVTFRVVAEDLEGTALSFAWSAASGTLATPVDSSSSSEVTWLASGACPAAVNVSVTDTGGAATTHQFMVDCPFTPGAARTVTGANLQLSDVHRSPAGTLFVVSNGGSYVGEIWVTRSDDGGATWTTTNLGNAAGNHTYIGRIFPINASTIGVTGTQGTSSPYDSHLRTSNDDGLTFNSSWINLSNSGDQFGNKSRGTVLQTPDGNYLGVWSWTGVYSRSSASLMSWSSTTRRDLGLGAGMPSLLTDGSTTYMAVTTPTGFTFHTSTDNGATFAQVSSTTTAEPWASMDVYRDPANGVMYACGGTSKSANARVYYMQSTDNGQSWTDETVYLDGINAGDLWIACHVDAAGITAAYLDASSGQMTIIPPG